MRVREGDGSNRPVEGDDCWNGVGEVGDVGRREDGWEDGEEAGGTG